jgi:hypothetical protein
MALPTNVPEQVTQLGIDDWSFRRGRKFGTILVDLATHKTIDLLAVKTGGILILNKSSCTIENG